MGGWDHCQDSGSEQGLDGRLYRIRGHGCSNTRGSWLVCITHADDRESTAD